MTLGNLEKYSIVIMDASDLSKVGKIFSYVESVVERESTDRKVQWHPLDENHPTTIVLEFEDSDLVAYILQKNIDDMYPGLCVFIPHI
jgi:hypothetical protein